MTTKIPWATGTWNPVTGCSKISAGCDNCYAERMAKRLRGRCGYPADEPFRVTFHEDKLDRPFHWKKPRRIFVCSMGDLFHKDVEQGHIIQVLLVASLAPRHTFIFLTKRPERMKHIMGIIRALHLDKIPENWWLGVTTENQKAADARVPILQQIPAAVRFVSVEPMLGPVDLSPFLKAIGIQHPLKPAGVIMCTVPGLNWVILGGETGPGARPMDPVWVRSVRDECQVAGIPFFFKGWGGNKKSGRLLNGREWSEYPRTGEQGLNHLP